MRAQRMFARLAREEGARFTLFFPRSIEGGFFLAYDSMPVPGRTWQRKARLETPLQCCYNVLRTGDIDLSVPTPGSDDNLFIWTSNGAETFFLLCIVLF